MKAKRRKSKSTMAKIQAQPLAEHQIQEFVSHYNKYKSFPGSKIPCNITGKLTTCVGPWMAKKIKEFGGAEQLLRNYKCRGALKTQKQIIKPVSKKSKRRIKIKELKDEQKNWDLPKMGSGLPTSLSDEEISESTKTACLRPDIHLNNDGHCEGCDFFNVCSSRLKCLPKVNSKKYKR